MVKTFTQSQCYGEYHCFHAKLDASNNFIDLHVGSPTPNIEHACLKPSFDPEVPYLMATLIPSDGSSSLQPPRKVKQQIQPSPSALPPTQIRPPVQGIVQERTENLNKIGRHAQALLKQYSGEFQTRMVTLLKTMVDQVKLLYSDEL